MTKPIKQSDLLQAIKKRLVGPAPVPEKGIVSLPEVVGPPLHILVAEDNPVNQRLMCRILQKRGHSTRIVQNGREALQALEQEEFACVLMDVQMPEMDGLEATRALRKKEAGTGSHLPVIAMTAHAMKGDRARCLEAGMDVYLAKPVPTADLFKALARIHLDRFVDPSPGDPTENPYPELTRAILLQACDGDDELLVELVGHFCQNYQAVLDEMRASFTARDASRLHRQAHKLKGTLSIFHLDEAVAQAQALENQTKSAEWEPALLSLSSLEEMLPHLAEHLQTLARQTETAAV